MMNKKWSIITVCLLIVSLLAGCGNAGGASASGTDQTIDKLTVGFVPSRDPDEIVTVTEPLKQLLKSELAKSGYEVGEVVITVGTNYEAVGEGLSAGTIDIGLIPGGTYVLYDDGAEVILTATRAGLNNDSDNPKDWNEHKPTEATDTQAIYYRSIIIAGPSEKGQALADKVNSGGELSFEDLNNATWAVMSSSSSAGYIYPALWLQEHYGKTITDLANVVQLDSYGSGFARLAAAQIDVMAVYADARRDNEQLWAESGRSASIWDETNVIGVTPGIYNDTVSVSKHSPVMNEQLKTVLQDAFINIANTEEGKQVISIYNHEGYQKAVPADYDNERNAQQIIKNMK